MNEQIKRAVDIFTELLNRRSEDILKAWIEQIFIAWREEQRKRIHHEELYHQSRHILEQLKHLLLRHEITTSWEPEPNEELVRLLTAVSESWAKQGLAAAQTALYVLSLKRVIITTSREENQIKTIEDFVALVGILDIILDQLSLIIVERFESARERIIKQQSLSLLELSTPVVKIWDQMILLPLVGVIDTTRARKITENLLNAIASAEAQVTIVDITGVPVLDTAVAGHLMKTIHAAQMLGTHVILTGMSPEGAQTLIKLGVSLHAVTTRANLRAGIAEGLAVMGKSIVTGTQQV
jgi:rsbT co-antagonist protein RsbR